MKSFVWPKHRFLCIALAFRFPCYGEKDVWGLHFGVPNIMIDQNKNKILMKKLMSNLIKQINNDLLVMTEISTLKVGAFFRGNLYILKQKGSRSKEKRFYNSGVLTYRFIPFIHIYWMTWTVNQLNSVSNKI